MNIFDKSRDEKLRRRLWSEWRDETGKKIKQLFTQFVSLGNERLRLSFGAAHSLAFCTSDYETESKTVEEDFAVVFEELLPFYQQLHAYVRRSLKRDYGEDVFPSSGHIPAHLLGDMWANSWAPIQDMLMPYPDKPDLNITKELLKQGYTMRKCYEVVQDFFISLGMEPMPQYFWNNSIFEKPKDGRNIDCTPGVFGYIGTDLRAMHCTNVTSEDFRVAYFVIGWLEYFIQARHLPLLLRQSPNPSFLEAFGRSLELFAQSPKYLHRLGLLPSAMRDKESDLNFMMSMALENVAPMAYGHMTDRWRWSVFREDITLDHYNQDWWDLRCKLQGVSSPIERTEDDLDPGAQRNPYDIHISTRYFFVFLAKFQFFKAMCDAAGHQGPLHTCDIYGSVKAGDKLGALMSFGCSEVWTVPFQALTGQTKLSAKPLLEYFQPLIAYLHEVNKHDTVGWTEACPPPINANAASAHVSTFTSVVWTGIFLVAIVF